MLVEVGNVFYESKERTHIAIGIAKVNKSNKEKEEDILAEMLSIWEKEYGVKFSGHLSDNVWEGEVPENLNIPIEDEPQKKDIVEYKKFSNYPFVLRDISLFVPKGVSQEMVEEEIKSVSRRLTLFCRSI